MGLLSFVGDIVQDVFGGSKSRKESAQYNAAAMAQQQAYAVQNMETQQSFNIQNMMMQQAFNRQNMTYQNQLNIDAFNRENEYNSPLQQRLRAQAAGINQNWQDGSGVVAQQDSGVSSSVPSGGMPSASPGGVPGVSSSLADPTSLIEGVMHLSRFNKEQKLLDAQIATEEAQARKLNVDADDVEMTRDDRIAQIRSLIKNTDADTQKLFREINLTDMEITTYFDRVITDLQNKQSITEYYDALKNECYALVDLKAANLDAQTRESAAHALYYDVMREYEPVRANAETIKAKAAQTSADAQHMEAEVEKALEPFRKGLLKAQEQTEIYSHGEAKERIKSQVIDNKRQALEYGLRKVMIDRGIPFNETQSTIDKIMQDTKVQKAYERLVNAQTKTEQTAAWRQWISTVSGALRDLGIGYGAMVKGLAGK